MLGIGPEGPLGPAMGAQEPHGIPPASLGGMTGEERIAWAALASIAELSPATFIDLVRSHGSARAVLEAAQRGAHALGAVGPIGPPIELPGLLAEAAERRAAIGAAVAAQGLAVVTADDPAYPARLRSIDLPPPVLFVLGTVEEIDAERCVAIVGTRRPTDAGRRLAGRIAGAIARHDAVVLSGLAIGVDGAAHAAAVAERRPTVAVIAGGHDRLYPSAHERLAEEIVRSGGAVVSEMAPGTPHLGHYFIRRNRLVAGLADAAVVVEAPLRSGALSTARWALGQGRECFVVPGPIDAPASAGCLALLRDYAPMTRVVAGIGELVEDLGLLSGQGRGRSGRRRRVEIATADLGLVEVAVADAVAGGRSSVDDIALATGHPTASVLAALTALEMRGLVVDIYGRYRSAGILASGSARG